MEDFLWIPQQAPLLVSDELRAELTRCFEVRPFQVRIEANRVTPPYPSFEASGVGIEKPLYTFSS